MGAPEIILIVACAALVIGVIVARILRKKKGKGGCDCGCSDCSACHYCAAAKAKQEKK